MSDITDQAIDEEIVRLQCKISQIEQEINSTQNRRNNYSSRLWENSVNQDLKELYRQLKVSRDLLKTITDSESY